MSLLIKGPSFSRLAGHGLKMHLLIMLVDYHADDVELEMGAVAGKGWGEGGW